MRSIILACIVIFIAPVAAAGDKYQWDVRFGETTTGDKLYEALTYFLSNNDNVGDIEYAIHSAGLAGHISGFILASSQAAEWYMSSQSNWAACKYPPDATVKTLALAMKNYLEGHPKGWDSQIQPYQYFILSTAEMISCEQSD